MRRKLTALAAALMILASVLPAASAKGVLNMKAHPGLSGSVLQAEGQSLLLL